MQGQSAVFVPSVGDALIELGAVATIDLALTPGQTLRLRVRLPFAAVPEQLAEHAHRLGRHAGDRLDMLRRVLRFGGLPVQDAALRVLVAIVRVTILINLLMFASEVFTGFYTGGSHSASLTYLFFGLHGHDALVPWTWASVILTVSAAILFIIKGITDRPRLLTTACVMAFVGIWIEKGMGLIVPGFIPSTLHEVVEYFPTIVEWQVSAGIWAVGLLVFTVALKVALPIFKGEETLANGAGEETEAATAAGG